MAFTTPVHTRSDENATKTIGEPRSVLDRLAQQAVLGRLAPREREELLGALGGLVSAVRAGVDIGTEGTGRAGDAARTGADDGWQALRFTRRRDIEEGGPQGVESPRRRYDDKQLSFDYELDASQDGPAGEAAKREAVAAVDDLHATGNVLALALSGDSAARRLVSLGEAELARRTWPLFVPHLGIHLLQTPPPMLRYLEALMGAPRRSLTAPATKLDAVTCPTSSTH